MSVEDNIAILRKQKTQAENKSRQLLAQYVAYRRRSYEAYLRLDPDSQFTKNSKGLLDTATRELEEFEASLVSLQADHVGKSASDVENPETAHSADTSPWTAQREE